VETILRIHFVQQWFGLSDPAMEEALHDTSLYCEFARLDPGASACLMQPKKAATAGHNAPEFGKNTICSFSVGS